MNQTNTENEIESLIQTLNNSNAHPDLARYARKAHERGGTPLLSSLRHSIEHVRVEKWATRGTRIEEALYRSGAGGALSCGNLDSTNTEICKEIVEEHY